MSKAELKIASISDIHIGAKRNTAAEIIKNLRTAFPNNAETAELDIIFICGDVFDGLLSLPDDAVTEVDTWIAFLIYVCAKHDILLRILEGTPSHDWKQSERFLTLAKVLQQPVDIEYVKELSIEYIERFDINVLYVPDEWESSTDKTLSQVKAMVRAKGLDKVDYAIMHGSFSYQLPENVKSPKHDPEEYLNLVRDLIFIGHIHVHSRYKRILAQGSFDRLSHGEEEPKGHLRVTVRDGNHFIKFVENKNAKIFKSIDCSFLSLEDTIDRIDSVVFGLPDNSHVRVIGNSENPIFTNINMLVKRYPLLVWSKLVRDNGEEEHLTVEDSNEILFTPITITCSNIETLLMDRISCPNLNPDVLAAAMGILHEVI